MEDKDLYISKIETSQMNYTNDLHRLSKEDFLKLCSDFYDGNIEVEYRKKSLAKLSDKFKSNNNIKLSSANYFIHKNYELEDFIESYLNKDYKLLEFDKKLKNLEYLFDFVGCSYKTSHYELWKMKCGGDFDSVLQVEFSKLINNSELKDYEYKGNIAYRLSNITECILKDFNDGKIVIGKKEIIAIANIVFSYFMKTLDLIKENIDTQEANKDV
jgi:hypothetical protein